jgi:hypothetical protein
MKDIVYKLYNKNQIPNGSNSSSNNGIAFLLLLFFIFIVALLSFYLKKTFLGRNWESHRCNYIFMSGFLQPDTSIKPHDYTLKNLKYCIKQTIYNDTPLLAHMKDTFDKLKYLIGFVKKQIGLYESHIKSEVDTKTNKYNDIMINKINYLRHKQKHLETIYNKLDGEFKETTEKIETGIDNTTELNNEQMLNIKYSTKRYVNYVK